MAVGENDQGMALYNEDIQDDHASIVLKELTNEYLFDTYFVQHMLK